MSRFSKGDRVRIDIPDESDPDHEQYHGEHGQIIAVLPMMRIQSLTIYGIHGSIELFWTQVKKWIFDGETCVHR